MSINNQFQITSTEFGHKGHIPPKYTCEGDNVNPPLLFQNIPEGTRSLALIVEDPDAPKGVFDHWVCWNISPNEAIAERSNPGINGTNSFGKIGYGGPCPPSGEHRYYFKIFALDTELNLLTGARKQEVLDAMKGHELATAELMGRYRKHKHAVAK